tara:strand:+ start:786 stop:1019 length:234 start_codon:yes stop_codon:yes gene_type:complete
VLSFSNIDKQVAEALMRMNSAEMKPLLTFFKNLDEETKRGLVHAGADTFARLQGRAGLLEEFLNAVESSAAVAEKLR